MPTQVQGLDSACELLDQDPKAKGRALLIRLGFSTRPIPEPDAVDIQRQNVQIGKSMGYSARPANNTAACGTVISVLQFEKAHGYFFITTRDSMHDGLDACAANIEILTKIIDGLT